MDLLEFATIAIKRAEEKADIDKKEAARMLTVLADEILHQANLLLEQPEE